MPRKKEANQLLLDFTTSRDTLKGALDMFAKATAALAGSLDGRNPETKLMIDEEEKATRQAIRRMVGVLADQSGLDFHACYTLAYHELHKKTGFHAVVASKGRGTHLDAVEKAGRLPDLQDTVSEMLTDDRYFRRVP